MSGQTFIDTYKACQAILDTDQLPDGVDGEFVDAQCEAISEAIVALLYEVDMDAWFEVVGYYVESGELGAS